MEEDVITLDEEHVFSKKVPDEEREYWRTTVRLLKEQLAAEKRKTAAVWIEAEKVKEEAIEMKANAVQIRSKGLAAQAKTEEERRKFVEARKAYSCQMAERREKQNYVKSFDPRNLVIGWTVPPADEIMRIFDECDVHISGNPGDDCLDYLNGISSEDDIRHPPLIPGYHDGRFFLENSKNIYASNLMLRRADQSMYRAAPMPNIPKIRPAKVSDQDFESFPSKPDKPLNSGFKANFMKAYLQ